MRTLQLLPVIALLLSAAPLTAQAACPEPEDPPVSVDVHSLTVELSVPRPEYRRQEALTVLVRVHMLAGSKASNAGVTVDLTRNGKRLQRLHGRTNSSGDAHIRLRAPSAAGRVDAVAIARLQAVPSYDCRGALVYQYGEQTLNPLLTVR